MRQLFKSLFRILFGERGPADIAVTRSSHDAHFRLPNQHPQANAWCTLIGLLFAIGAYAAFLFVNETWPFPEERNYWGLRFGAAAIVAAMIDVFLRMCIDWHYEILLTRAELQVFYATPGPRWRMVKIDTGPVRRLIVVARDLQILLQAEAEDGSGRLVLKIDDHGRILKLAGLLAREHARLVPHQPALSVADETLGTAQEPAERTLGSKIVVTKQETGVTLDFPQGEDERVRASRRAWRTFELGMIALLAALVWFAFCRMTDAWYMQPLSLALFVVGLVTVLKAGEKGLAAWQIPGGDGELRQLSVAGNLLIRTTRDHRKQIWYRQEIRAIRVEEKVVDAEAEGQTSTPPASMHLFHLIVELQNGEKTQLTGGFSNSPQTDHLPNAGLEWVATRLWQALNAEPGETPAPPPAIAADRASSQAITELADRAEETRIST